MTDIKKELSGLSPTDQAEISAFLFHLRHASDPDYQGAVQRRMDDKDPSHWLTLDEVEKRLDKN